MGAGRPRARSARGCPARHNPKLATGDVEVLAEELQVLNRCPTPPFEVMSIPQEGQTFGDPELADEDLRLQYRYLDLRRPTLQRTLDPAAPPEQGHPRLSRQPGLPGAGNAAAGPQHAGRGPRLPGAEPRLPGRVVRPAAVAAALQATADGGRLRQVFPDRPLPARRGPARRPPAGVHAARPGNVVRRAWTTSSASSRG